MRQSKSILYKVCRGVCRTMLALGLICSIVVAQSGIEFKQHICAESGHEHVDLDLIAGISALNVCLDDEDDCCRDHNDAENECGDCCTDLDTVANADIISITKSNKNDIATPQCITLYSTITSDQISDAVVLSNHKIDKHFEINAAQTHTRLCALLCTMLC